MPEDPGDPIRRFSNFQESAIRHRQHEHDRRQSQVGQPGEPHGAGGRRGSRFGTVQMTAIPAGMARRDSRGNIISPENSFRSVSPQNSLELRRASIQRAAMGGGMGVFPVPSSLSGAADPSLYYDSEDPDAPIDTAFMDVEGWVDPVNFTEQQLKSFQTITTSLQDKLMVEFKEVKSFLELKRHALRENMTPKDIAAVADDKMVKANTNAEERFLNFRSEMHRVMNQTCGQFSLIIENIRKEAKLALTFQKKNEQKKVNTIRDTTQMKLQNQERHLNAEFGKKEKDYIKRIKELEELIAQLQPYAEMKDEYEKMERALQAKDATLHIYREQLNLLSELRTEKDDLEKKFLRLTRRHADLEATVAGKDHLINGLKHQKREADRRLVDMANKIESLKKQHAETLAELQAKQAQKSPARSTPPPPTQPVSPISPRSPRQKPAVDWEQKFLDLEESNMEMKRTLKDREHFINDLLEDVKELRMEKWKRAREDKGRLSPHGTSPRPGFHNDPNHPKSAGSRSITPVRGYKMEYQESRPGSPRKSPSPTKEGSGGESPEPARRGKGGKDLLDQYKKPFFTVKEGDGGHINSISVVISDNKTAKHVDQSDEPHSKPEDRGPIGGLLPSGEVDTDMERSVGKYKMKSYASDMAKKVPVQALAPAVVAQPLKPTPPGIHQPGRGYTDKGNQKGLLTIKSQGPSRTTTPQPVARPKSTDVASLKAGLKRGLEGYGQQGPVEFNQDFHLGVISGDKENLGDDPMIDMSGPIDPESVAREINKIAPRFEFYEKVKVPVELPPNMAPNGAAPPSFPMMSGKAVQNTRQRRASSAFEPKPPRLSISKKPQTPRDQAGGRRLSKSSMGHRRTSKEERRRSSTGLGFLNDGHDARSNYRYAMSMASDSSDEDRVEVYLGAGDQFTVDTRRASASRSQVYKVGTHDTVPRQPSPPRVAGVQNKAVERAKTGVSVQHNFADPQAVHRKTFVSDPIYRNVPTEGKLKHFSGVSKILKLDNMVSLAEVGDEEERLDIVDDIRTESEKFGQVRAVIVPPANSQGFATLCIGSVFVMFSSENAAVNARADYSSRTFSGRRVLTSYFRMEDFEALVECLDDTEARLARALDPPAEGDGAPPGVDADDIPPEIILQAGVIVEGEKSIEGLPPAKEPSETSSSVSPDELRRASQILEELEDMNLPSDDQNPPSTDETGANTAAEATAPKDKQEEEPSADKEDIPA